MVMSIIRTPPPLIFLLMIYGVYSAADDWSVSYSSLHICALKNSTVTINCTYKYPTGHHIKKVFWTKTDATERLNEDEPLDLSEDSEYRERIQYLGDKQHDCSVKLTDVRQTDSNKYYFRFITDKPDGKWIGASGVTLDITDPPIPVISISSSGVIVEGDSVTLTCSSESNPPANISWFKEETSVGSGNIYIISNIRSDHSGQYKCKTRNKCGARDSQAVMLNVMYSPRNVVASISSSGVIVEGDSVTLTCSSESNPPAKISWFKENQTSVGSGNIFIISNIRFDHSGQYKCKARNKHGHKYSAVTLNVLYPPRNVSASISSSGVIVEGDSVNLTCSSESNPPVHIYSWFKENQTSSVGSGQTFSISNFNSSLSGLFYCVSQNEVGSQRSAAVSVTVKGNVMFYTIVGGALVSGSAVILLLLIWRIRWMKQRRNSQSQIDHQSPSQNRSKSSDPVYENVMIANDGSDDSDSSTHDYENITRNF